MNLTAFIPENNENGACLLQAVEKSLPEGTVVLSRNYEDLRMQLVRPADERNCALLFAEDKKDLSFFAEHADWFRDFKIILILPDGADNTLSVGFRLHPRYIGYADCNLQEVIMVLKKMLKNGFDHSASDCDMPEVQKPSGPERGVAYGSSTD